MEIENNTPYPAAWLACTDEQGRDSVVLVAKATYDFDPSGRLTLADPQLPIQAQDSHRGEPGRSSTLWESDLAWAKAGTDLILLGHAHADPHSAPGMGDVTLAVGPVRKAVRIFGDRHWQATALGVRFGPPEAFDRIPLIYERAFGGRDESPPGGPDEYAANPVGTGYRLERRDLDGVALPNLEDPRSPIRHWSDRPPPAGFGFYGRSWSPRRERAGTFDERWRRTRCPLLPDDFELRHLNAAHPELIAPEPLRGGEPIVVEHASPVSPLRLTVPRLGLTFYAVHGGRLLALPPRLDTLVIDTDRSRLVLVSRARFACHRQILRLGGFRLDEAEEAA